VKQSNQLRSTWALTMDDLVPKFYNQRTHHSVWQYDFDSKKMGHLTPKPIELLSTIIKHCTEPGDLVLDCFGGSGSTAISAINTQRDYLLIEREQKYVDITLERIKNHVQPPNRPLSLAIRLKMPYLKDMKNTHLQHPEDSILSGDLSVLGLVHRRG
jgi:hypothetical protein